MSRRATLIGLVFALVSTIAYSLVYVFSKAALNQVTLAQFGVYWFFIAVVEIGIYFFIAGLWREFWALSKRKKLQVVVIALIEVVATALFFLSIKLFRNPAAVSFISTLIPIFVGLISFKFLHERFNLWESLGIVLTIVGALIISYQSTVLGEIEHSLLGLLAAFAFVLLFALNTVFIRVVVKDVHPVIIAWLRAIFLWIFWIVVMIFSGQSLQIPAQALKNIVIGATLGPFVGLLANIFALKYIEATITSVFINSKGFFILLIAYWYLGLKPEMYQIIGGALTVVGVVIMSFGKYLKVSYTKKLSQTAQ